jgi:hypothetical protein
MADIKLHEIGNSVAPDPTYRVASGKAGVTSVNTTWQDIVDYISTQIGYDPNTEAIIESGAWNMDSTETKNVSYTPPSGYEVVSYGCTIIGDNGALKYPIDYEYSEDSPNTSGYIIYTGTQFQLWRKTSGYFDSTGFNDGAMNRAYIYVKLRLIPS